jgi:hypothetical protein
LIDFYFIRRHHHGPAANQGHSHPHHPQGQGHPDPKHQQHHNYDHSVYVPVCKKRKILDSFLSVNEAIITHRMSELTSGSLNRNSRIGEMVV